jgi:hypothetical protein
MTRADLPEREPPPEDGGRPASELQGRLRAELRDHAERDPVDTRAGWALVERRMRREPMRRGLAVAAGVAAVIAVAAVLPRLVPRTDGASPRPAVTGPVGPATVATGASPSTGAPVPRRPPELRADGLGEFSFGAGPAAVIGRLRSQLGEAPVDTGWVDGGRTPYGTCPGARARAVTFGRLAVLFSDGPTPFAGAGHQHFIGWVIREGGGGAAGRVPFGNERVTTGEPFQRLTAVYGRQARMLDRGTRFEVGPRASGGPLDGVPRFHGDLRGPRDTAVIATLGAGLRCAGENAGQRRPDAAASTASA